MNKVRWKQERWISRVPDCMICHVTCGECEGFFIPKERFVLTFSEGRMWVYELIEAHLVPERQEVYQITGYKPNRLSTSDDTKRWLKDPLHLITNYLIMRDEDGSPDAQHDSNADGSNSPHWPEP